MNIQEFKIKILPTKNMLYRVAYRIVNDPAEAEDVVQEVFIKIWNKREELGSVDNLEGFCMRMTKNLAIDKTRSKHKRTKELGAGLDFVAATANPHQMVETNDTIEGVKKLMEQLPEKQRLVMQLRDIEELTYEEIAKAIDIPMNQVKVNLFRARKKIKELLLKDKEYGLQ